MILLFHFLKIGSLYFRIENIRGWSWVVSYLQHCWFESLPHCLNVHHVGPVAEGVGGAWIHMWFWKMIEWMETLENITPTILNINCLCLQYFYD